MTDKQDNLKVLTFLANLDGLCNRYAAAGFAGGFILCGLAVGVIYDLWHLINGASVALVAWTLTMGAVMREIRLSLDHADYRIAKLRVFAIG